MRSFAIVPVAVRGRPIGTLAVGSTQEQEFEPVGSSATRRVDVRVIAATNRNTLSPLMDPLCGRAGGLPQRCQFFVPRARQTPARSAEHLTRV